MTDAPRFTVRVEGDRIVVSTDDGSTGEFVRTRHPRLYGHLRHAHRQVIQGGLSVSTSSAAALASLAEAANLEPTDCGLPPPHPIAASLTRAPRKPLGPDAEGAPAVPLRDVLARRRSRRSIGSTSARDLAALLVRAGRTRTFTVAGHFESRAYPSAGARHPNELVLAAHGVQDLDDGWWWFVPFTCELAPVDLHPDPDKVLSQLAEVAATATRPTAAVFAVAAFERTVSRYPAGATLVWRDAGVALATLHLAATELGLASCIVGTAGLIDFALERKPGLVADVGAVMVGTTIVDP